MKSDKMSYVRRMLITRRPADVPVRVSLRSYARFADWLDSELRKLVARWSPHMPSHGRSVEESPPTLAREESRR
jgi:hypothetical protein